MVAQNDPRVYLAAERTFLAWIRTGLAMMGFGFVVARFGVFLHEMSAARGTVSAEPTWSMGLGTGLVILGVVTVVFAILQQLRFKARFDRGEAFETPRATMMLVLAISLAAAGVGLSAYLFTRP